MVTSRCKIDVNGITAPVSRVRAKFLSWKDINSVNIKCSNAYMRYHVAYLIEFKSNDFTVKLKTNGRVVKIIMEFSKDCDNFQRMFLERLNEAEK